MTRALLAAALLAGCGVVPEVERPDSDAGLSGSADSGQPDAGVSGSMDGGQLEPDAGTRPGWASDVQPIFQAKCVRCHESVVDLPAFAVSHAALLEPSKLCPGVRVGVCVKEALAAQEPEGSGCRTYVVRPFHRAGWTCLTPEEIATVTAWVDDGMPEQ